MAFHTDGGWSGGAMVLGKLPVPGRPTILITVGQGPIVLAVGAGGGGLDIFTLIYPFSSFSLSLGDGSIWTEILSQRAVKPKTTNQPSILMRRSAILIIAFIRDCQGWSGGAMVLGKLPVPGRPIIWIKVGQGPTALAVGAGGGCLDIFTLIYPFYSLPPALWKTARYRLKYCIKGPLNPTQPTNQIVTVMLCLEKIFR